MNPSIVEISLIPLHSIDLNDEGLRQLVSAVAAVGFHVTHVQSETVAAVFGAFPTLGMNHTLLVVDVGGSSCKLSLVRQDLAVCRVDFLSIYWLDQMLISYHHQTEVIAQVIDPFCGGTYFDDEVYDYMLRHHRRIAESPAYLSALSSALEQAKRDLVHSESAQIQLDVGSMGNVTWHLDRHIFETVNKALYLSLAQKISRFLADEQSGVHKIILTGGSALAPGLAATLSQSLAHHSAEVRTITNSTVVLQRSALLLTARRRVSLAFDLVFQSYRGNFTLIEKGTVLPFHQSFRLGRPILSTRTTIKLWQIHGDDYTYPVALQTFWMPMQSSLVVDLSVMDDGQLHGRAYDGTKQSLQSSFDGSVLVNCTWVQTTTRTD
ncbi:hypothetical protein DL93DRAFT_1177698 [Clavulina sp. PMI_390]|nr:hypothetical protein DL93DRAFT_1177698 [Clavulina sp. PMI_390]